MKLIFFIFFIPLITLGQKEYDTKIEDQSRPGILWYVSWRPSNKPKPRKYDRLVFDIHYNDFKSNLSLSSKSIRSIGFTSNFLNEIPLNNKSTLSIGYGLGISVSKTLLNQNLVESTPQIISCFPQTNSDAYIRNSLIGSNVNLPVELRIRTKGWKHTKLYLGGRVGYQLTLKEKYSFADMTRNHKISLKNAAEDFTYSLYARTGFRNYALYASYQLNSIFQHPESPQLNWLQVGLSISLF